MLQDRLIMQLKSLNNRRENAINFNLNIIIDDFKRFNPTPSGVMIDNNF